MSRQTISELIQHVRRCEDTQALWEVMLAFLHGYGAQRISYHHYAGLDGEGVSTVGIRAEGFPDSWVCTYLGEKLYLVDPIPALARSAMQPFFWKDVRGLVQLNAAERDYMKRLESSNLGDGLALQVYGPAMRNGYVGIGFGPDRPDFTASDIFEIQSGVQLGHIRYCELTQMDSATASKDLAPREREILLWMARGKSNASIASILGVSRHTVDTQIRRLFAKLDVADRTSAAIRGLGAGLILPGDVTPR
ncbi:helix-turn-helix transcriptional regulator [Primorskyibacter sp. S187A]|uniref:helix-turn-helix transcriptional regulator n=1 Tax=Primorskyibacter sp. S187A TaxID=3415130 RepID=UPI003C7BFC74